MFDGVVGILHALVEIVDGLTGRSEEGGRG